MKQDEIKLIIDLDEKASESEIRHGIHFSGSKVIEIHYLFGKKLLIKKISERKKKGNYSAKIIDRNELGKYNELTKFEWCK